jgi:TusA-related sulfurtransferase
MRNRLKVNKILDVQGLLCPVPTVMTRNTLKEMKKGMSLQVITNDTTTKESIPSLCAQKGYTILELKEKEGLLYFTIRR